MNLKWKKRTRNQHKISKVMSRIYKIVIDYIKMH